MVVVAALLAACSPEQVGTLALTQRDGSPVVAVMRCDDTALERVAISHAGPLRSDGPRQSVVDARWSTDQEDDDIIVLDTSRPGREWDVHKRVGDLDDDETYSVSAGGDTDHSMGSVGFTTAELAMLPEGRWLTADSEPEASTGVRPTVTNLKALRSHFCGAG
ncbi:hypothetical protein DX116_11635 [Aeromicrobium endophyticum]|uniref:Uncharacterized protein n=1 Tax=Aeromicrobium endophyticum TaxID=2292704 RepID=A0A371P2K9_9ACTN|nr:hypothetical protein DX116_11635 [Aeromicrobium endophyticum]